MKRRMISIFILAFIAFGGTAVVHRTKSLSVQARIAANARPITIAIAKGVLTILPVIAREKKFFESEGLNVRYTPYYASGKQSFDAMLSGGADISTPATTPVVLKSFERNDFSIFLTYTTTYRGVKIIAGKNRGIRTQSDIKGKTIGYARGTISHVMVESLLANNKIHENEIRLRDIPPELLPEAVSAGTVDAIAVWEPLASRASAKLGPEAIYVPTADIYRIALNLVAMNVFIAKNPDIIYRIIRAMARAEIYSRENKDEAQEIVSKVVGLDIAFVRRIWDDYVHRLVLDQQLIITMEDEAEWAINAGITNKTEVPNYLHFIYAGALKRFRPEAVTLIK